MVQPPTCGLEGPGRWPVPEGATALMGEQEGSRALPVGLHPEDSHYWESSMAGFLAQSHHLSLCRQDLVPGKVSQEILEPHSFF